MYSKMNISLDYIASALIAFSLALMLFFKQEDMPYVFLYVYAFLSTMDCIKLKKEINSLK